MSPPETDNADASQAASEASQGNAPVSESGAAVKGVEPTRAGMKWYVLRVASNKEDQVCETLERKVRIENLQERIGRILVPTAKEKRMKAGQVKIIEKKLYPGYVDHSREYLVSGQRDDGSRRFHRLRRQADQHEGP